MSCLHQWQTRLFPFCCFGVYFDWMPITLVSTQKASIVFQFVVIQTLNEYKTKSNVWNHSGRSEQAALFHSSPTIIQLWLILSSASPHLPVCICLQEERGMDLQSLNIESLEQLKYTSCVIKETLRINPPVPGGFRVALKTFELNVS